MNSKVQQIVRLSGYIFLAIAAASFLFTQYYIWGEAVREGGRSGFGDLLLLNAFAGGVISISCFLASNKKE